MLDTWRRSESVDIRPEGSVFSSVTYSDEGMYTCRLTHIPMDMMPVERSIELRITGELVEPLAVSRCILSCEMVCRVVTIVTSSCSLFLCSSTSNYCCSS